MPEPTEYQEGQTATNPTNGRRVVYRSGMWVNDPTVTGATVRRPSATDQAALRQARSVAQAERDVTRQYNNVESAVETMGTGPLKAWALDVITPEAGDGFWDSVGEGVGGILGAVVRPFVSNETMEARDHLRTVNARAALSASADVKGAASDRDMALMRLSGVSPHNSEAENNRVIQDARRQSGMSQLRARLTDNWITRYGSLSAPAPGGMTFTDYLQVGETDYNRSMDNPGEARARPNRPTAPPRRPAAAAPTSTQSTRSLPEVPPSRRGSSSRTVTIDINGNVIGE